MKIRDLIIDVTIIGAAILLGFLVGIHLERSKQESATPTVHHVSDHNPAALAQHAENARLQGYAQCKAELGQVVHVGIGK